MKTQSLPVFVFLLLLSIPTGCAAAQEGQTTGDGGQAGAARVDDSTPVPEQPQVKVIVGDVAALEKKMKSFAGKFVVVDIWSTSCAPCMREFPHLIDLSREYPDRVACISFNVDFIGIPSKPPESYLPKVEQFLSTQNATITNLLSSTPDEEVLAKYKAGSLPAILIFDRSGKLAHTLTDANSGEDGLSYEGDVIPKLKSLLAR